jgi:hypothetical protein
MSTLIVEKMILHNTLIKTNPAEAVLDRTGINFKYIAQKHMRMLIQTSTHKRMCCQQVAKTFT